MTNRTAVKEQRRQQDLRREAERQKSQQARKLRNRVLLGTGGALLILAGIFALSSLGGASSKYPYKVGQPGPGRPAPSIALASTTGGTFNLAAHRGTTTLLYFQEGLTCQPCWDQLKDLDTNLSQLRALGIDQLVSITTDPLDALRSKVSDEGITTPVLSDPTLTVSQAYAANRYGMMGSSRDGHSFVVVGPNGVIRWRADYGGPPNYTMYVPVPNLVAALRKGLDGSSS